ncbi:MAG TPA: carboxy terminal-processing peptidase [Chitinophagaceae bacterium]|nr:carboxy terminal-processing peptidase [Chitinophagaceae bacterium]
MLSRKVLPLLLIVLFGSIFWAFKGRTTEEEPTLAKQQRLLTGIGQILEARHYSPKAIDDDFSKQVFDKYLKSLDPDKDVFLQSDITGLKKYETTIDDEINGAPIQFFPAAGGVYKKRLDEAIADYTAILQKPFDFNLNESAQLDGDKLDYPATEAARQEVWRKRAKFLTLEKYVDLLNYRDKNKNVDSIAQKTNARLESEARAKTLAALNKVYTRVKLKFTEEEQFNQFVNTITDLMDPHTEYFPPVEKRGFDEEMSGHFFGIGAQLKEEDNVIKIATLIPGSPAWKSQKIQVNDIILKVAQGNAEAVDIAGYDVTDVVKIIRGDKGTEVRLTLKKADGTIQVVPIIRGEIVQDESFARSVVAKKGNKKIGYIYLPEFYADFENPKGARCSVDVAREIEKLKAEHIDGLVLDLRGNGGGALYEVVQMVGLFIPSGPVVQVRDRDAAPNTLSDNEPGVLYTGPLTVMVNEMSASASEIFAAAIQDYKRGLIVGSTSTYGKGTVQKNLPLGRPVDLTTGATEYGALKLTFEKFYRINGNSTQLKGVTPDVILPDQYDYFKFREKDQPSALKWDQIQPANYTVWNEGFDWNNIIQNARQHVNASNIFATIKTNTDWLSANVDKDYDLNIDKYKQEQALLKDKVRQTDSLTRLTAPLDMQPVEVDKDKFFNNPDKAKGDRYQAWLKSVRSDVYISETLDIVNDIINRAANVTAKLTPGK